MYYFDASFSCFSGQYLGYSCFCCQELQEFSWIYFHDLEKSYKFLRTLPRLIAKILARDLKNPGIFLARNPRFFLVLLPRSWIVLVFLPRSPKFFLDSFPRSWKILQNLRTLSRIIAKILARNVKNLRNFLARKPGRQALGMLANFLAKLEMHVTSVLWIHPSHSTNKAKILCHRWKHYFEVKATIDVKIYSKIIS